MGFSDTWFAAGIIGAALMGTSFFVHIVWSAWSYYIQSGMTMKEKEKLFMGVFREAQMARKNVFKAGVLIGPILLLFMYIALVVNDRYVWGLRITRNFPGAATECSESIANMGTCGTYLLQVFHGAAVFVNCIMSAMFLRWKQYSGIVAVFGAGLVSTGLIAFEFFGDSVVRWIFIAVATAGWLVIVGIHIFSGVESFMDDGGAIRSAKRDSKRGRNPLVFPDQIIPDEGWTPTSAGKYVNGVNYPIAITNPPYTTGEAVWNIICGILLNYSMLLVLFAFLSPQGMNQYTMGTYLMLMMTTDVIHFFLGSFIQLNWWNMKSDQEIYSYGKKMGSKSTR